MPRTHLLCTAAALLAVALTQPLGAGEALPAEVADRLARLEATVLQLGEELQAMKAGCPSAPPAPTPSPAVVASKPGTPAVDISISGEEARLLPSRSVAGGSYGAQAQAVATHGFVDLEYVDFEPQGSRGGVSTFDSHHANVFFDAVLRPELRAHLEVEYEHAGDTVEIDQAYMAWDATSWLTVEAGRFYTPFGIERFAWYSPTSHLVSRPPPMREIIPGNWYADGILVTGILHDSEGKPAFTYEAALSNGLGDAAAGNRRGSRQTRDNNSNRAVSGRVSWVGYPWWEAGASYHTQTYDGSSDDSLTFVGLDFAGRYRGFELRAEWLRADAERSSAAQPLPDLEQDGWYAQLAYTFDWDREFLPGLTLATRYSAVDLDRSLAGNDDRETFSLGASLRIYDHFKVKAEYQLISEQGAKRDDDGFLAQFVIDF